MQDEFEILKHEDSPGKKNVVRRSLRLTPEGIVFLIILGFIAFGAILRNVNLLIVLAGMMVSAMLLNWRSAKIRCKTINGFRQMPRRVYAGEMFSIVWQVSNESPQRVWNINVEDRVKADHSSGDSADTKPLGFLARFQHRMTSSSSRPIGLGETRVNVPQIAPYGSESNIYHCLLNQRGRYCVGPSTISTTFPFGLIEVELKIENEQTFYAAPPIGKLSPNWERQAAAMSAGLESAKRKRGTRDEEFFAIRQWRPGDSRRNIHWRTTAKMQQPMIRQFDEPTHRDLAIIIDLATSPQTPNEKARHSVQERFDAAETILSFASTITSQPDDTFDGRVSIAICGQQNDVFLRLKQRQFNANLNRSLAMAKTAKDPNLFSAITAIGEGVSPETPIFVLSTRNRPAWLMQLDENSPTANNGANVDVLSTSALPTSVLPNSSLARLSKQIRWLDVDSEEFSSIFSLPSETEEAHIEQLQQRWG